MFLSSCNHWKSITNMAACGRHFSSGVRHRAHLGRLVSQSGVLLKSTGRGRRHGHRHGYRRETISPSLGYCRGFLCPALSVAWLGVPLAADGLADRRVCTTLMTLISSMMLNAILE